MYLYSLSGRTIPLAKFLLRCKGSLLPGTEETPAVKHLFKPGRKPRPRQNAAAPSSSRSPSTEPGASSKQCCRSLPTQASPLFLLLMQSRI